MALPVFDNNPLLYKQWQNFIKNDETPEGINPVVLESWKRSREYGVDPLDGSSSIILPNNELVRRLKQNSQLVDAVKIYTDRIYSCIKGAGYLIFLTDSDGFLLHIAGDRNVLKDFENNLNFKVGASWSEEAVGTTAVCLALSEKSPIPFISQEKYCMELKKRTCCSVPVRDPAHDVAGVLGVAADKSKANEDIFAMLLIAQTAVENHLKTMEAAENVGFLSHCYKSVLDTVSDGIITVDSHGVLININKSAERLLNVDANSAIGRRIEEAFDFGPNIIDILKSGTGKCSSEFMVSSQHGGPHIIKNNVHVIQKDGQVGGAVNIIREMDRDKKQFFCGADMARARFTFQDIIGCSRAMQEAKRQAEAGASSPAAVLITGESGTGKELFAQAIHNASGRRCGPFIAINCGALPRELVESEFFGYEEGAFTGAVKGGRPGKFEMASGGTIFLDEIGEMPPDFQTKLLRVLQEKEIVRVGGFRPTAVDVKVVAATNKDLFQEVRKGTFREDLYWRLNVIAIAIPSLDMRREDIPLLARHFIKKHCSGGSECRIDDEALGMLMKYHWPGNVRELENIIERAAAFMEGNVLRPGHLPGYIAFNFSKPSGDKNKNSLEDMERCAIEKCLHDSGGNISMAAKMLGIARNTLYCKLKKYNMVSLL